MPFKYILGSALVCYSGYWLLRYLIKHAWGKSLAPTYLATTRQLIELPLTMRKVLQFRFKKIGKFRFELLWVMSQFGAGLGFFGW